METDLFGIVNGHQVNGHLLRGGDVSGDGIKTLAQANVRLIICLKNRKQDSQPEIDMERRLAFAAGIEFINRPMDSSGIFSYDDGEEVPEILDLIDETEGGVLVHCHHGSDRTGVVVACYRIRHDKSTADKAIAEMKKYGASWIHFGMRAFVKRFAETISFGRI